MTDRGCYGLASVHNSASTACQNCAVKQGCVVKVLDILNRVRKVIPVEALVERIEINYLMLDVPSIPKLTLSQVTTIATMPRHLQGRLKVLLLAGFHLVAMDRFQRGLNPFKGAKHLHLTGQMLLGGGFTKSELRAECVKRYGWTEGTASSQVSQALALLRGLGLTREISNKTVLAGTAT